MRSNLPTEKKLNTLVKKSVDLKPLQILGWKGIKSKNTAILTLKYPSWEQKVRRPRVKKSGDKKSGKTSNLQGKLVFVQKWGRRTFSMEIGWFWGEIRVLWWRQLINTAVGHYLWGIDTSVPDQPGINWLPQSDITYEELIRSLWKTSTCDLSHKQSRTLPMRNWYSSTAKSSSRILSSDITYEELIPASHPFARIFTFTTFGSVVKSDITYEELIQSSSVMTMLIFELQSDITYEELIQYP